MFNICKEERIWIVYMVVKKVTYYRINNKSY